MAFRKLSPTLQSDVLADGVIAERFALPVTRPTRLSDKIVIKSETLFSAFRNAADGEPLPAIIDENDTEVDATVQIDPDGAGVVEIGGKAWRFAHAALLSRDSSHRLATLEAALCKHTIAARDVAELRTLVANPQFSDDDFVRALGLLASSPESFAAKLREKVAIRQVGEADLLPENIRHWDNITAPQDRSTTLANYIEDELGAERRSRISSDPVRAFESITLAFSAPALVPRAMFKSLDPDCMFRMIDSILQFDDHFALGGGFEICAGRIETDARFVTLGDRLLDRLFGDMNRLKNACGMFSAAFVIATARLAVHDVLRHQPIYWRRLAAASHASLIVRTCGVSDIGHKELISWAMRTSGEEYLLSVFSDMAVEPQWRPEWADARFMAADIFGRVYGTYVALPTEIVPGSWRERIEAAKAWVDNDKLNLLMGFPAVLEGARRSRTPTTSEFGEAIADAYRRLSDEPSIDNLLCLTPVIQAFGVPAGINIAVGKVVDQIRSGADGMDDDIVQAALTLTAHIAVLTNDIALADAILETCVEMALGIQEQSSLYQVFFRLVECTSANPNREAARIALAKRLEFLAFRLPISNKMAVFAALLEVLRKVVPDFAPLLGRAIASSKLAVHRSAAA
jgi:hypothetical protein